MYRIVQYILVHTYVLPTTFHLAPPLYSFTVTIIISGINQCSLYQAPTHHEGALTEKKKHPGNLGGNFKSPALNCDSRGKSLFISNL